MKRFKRIVCFLLVASLFAAAPIYAAEGTARSSNYFWCSSVYLHKTSATTFEAWFDVGAVEIMDKLGATVIKIQRSSDGTNWETMRTYRSTEYPGMICDNTAAHAYGVSYTNATPTYYYRAYITLYAKNEHGYAEMYHYTSTLRM